MEPLGTAAAFSGTEMNVTYSQLKRFRDMERRGNIMLVQRFGGIAWFILAYGCNDNKEDNSC